MSAVPMPSELWEDEETLVAVRSSEAMTRGRAQAYLAAERDVHFIDIDVRRAYFQPADPDERSEDYPVQRCGRYAEDATPFWEVV